MSPFRVAALLLMCGIALSGVGKSATPQNSATKQAAQPDDIPKSIAESVSGTLQFAEGNFLGLAEAMPEDKSMICSSLNRLLRTTPPLTLGGSSSMEKSHFQWTHFGGAGHDI